MPGDQDHFPTTYTNINYTVIILKQSGSVRDKQEATLLGTAPTQPSDAWNTGKEEEEVWEPVW